MKLKETDLEISFLKGSGPGGQNRNKRFTGVRITHLPTGLTVMATERRSQFQNLEVAKERIEEKVARAFKKVKRRISTKKSQSSDLRRLEQKKRDSHIKKLRSSRED
jgi:protein subunit release factor B